MYRRLTTFVVLLMVGLLMAPPVEGRRRRWGRWGKKTRKVKKKKRRVKRTVRAAGGKKVVVLGFRGPKASRARAGFIGGVRRRARLVSPRKYQQTASELGVKPRSADGISRICSRLACDAVVSGVVAKRGRRRFVLTVTVYNGGTGAKLGRRSAKVRRTRNLKRAGGKLGRRCRALVAKGRRPSGEAVASTTPEPKSTAPPSGGSSGEDDDLFDTGGGTTGGTTTADSNRSAGTEDIPKPPSPMGNDEDDEDDEEDEEDEAIRKRSSGPTKLAGLFSIGASFGMTKRGYTLSPKESDGERTYEGGWYPAFTVAADFYPMVLASRGFIRNIGLGVVYGRHVSISTEAGEGSSTTGEAVGKTGSQQLLIDLRLRYSFGDYVTALGLAGFGMHDFTLGANDVLASLNYKFIRVGVSGIVPFGTPLLAAHVGFEVRPIISVGKEMANHFGSREGSFGWSLSAGLGGSLSFGLFYFTSFEYQSYSASFKGLDEAGITPVANSPDMGPASEGTDTYFRIWLGAGYAM